MRDIKLDIKWHAISLMTNISRRKIKGLTGEVYIDKGEGKWGK